MLSRTASAPAQPFYRRPAFGLTLLIGAAIGIRAWMLFGSPLVPGMNGAYYLVQARSLLEHGQLGIPDLPLTFWLHAALAKLLGLLSGLSQDDAIVWAVKLADATLPPLAAVPVAWMARRWRGSTAESSPLVWLLPAAAVCLGSQALRMTGDFQKNSLALVWLAALAPAAFRFLRSPSAPTMVAPLGLLALLGLTHVGVLGAALVFCAILSATALLRAEGGRRQRRHILALMLSGTAVLTLAGGITYTLYDPARVSRLAGAFTSPLDFIDGHEEGRHEPGHPPPGMEPMNGLPESGDIGDRGEAGFTPAMASRTALAGEDPTLGSSRVRPASDAADADAQPFARDRFRPAGGPPPGGPGGQGMPFDSRTSLPTIAYLLVSGAAGWIAWRRRHTLPMAETTVVFAAAVTGTLLSLPFFDGQKSERLILIAAVPAAIAGSFLLSRFTTRVWVHWIGSVAVLSLVAGSARGLPMAHNAGVSASTVAELRSLAPLIEQPEQTLIVARHGLEWWTAWTLHTHIAQPMAVSESDWSNYAHVLYLQEKRQMEPPGFRSNREGLPPPPGSTPGGPRFVPDTGPGPGMGGMGIPSDAQTIHDGENLTLARVVRLPQRAFPQLSRR